MRLERSPQDYLHFPAHRNRPVIHSKTFSELNITIIILSLLFYYYYDHLLSLFSTLQQMHRLVVLQVADARISSSDEQQSDQFLLIQASV